MSILDPKYDINILFTDLVNVYKQYWNCSFFNLNILSTQQLETHMVNGTFEPVFQELLAAYYEETCTRCDNMATIMYKAITPYLKHDPNTMRPRHIYTYSMNHAGWYMGETAYNFVIWDDYQREHVFEVTFSFKNV